MVGRVAQILALGGGVIAQELDQVRLAGSGDAHKTEGFATIGLIADKSDLALAV